MLIIISQCSKISQAATTESQFGLVDGDFSLENVNCAGNETALTDCEHKRQNTCFRWAHYDDDSDLCYLHIISHEAAGVICAREAAVTLEPGCGEVDTLCLAGGNTPASGNVYIGGR